MGVLRNAMLHQYANILFGNCALLIKFQYYYAKNKYIEKQRLQNKEIEEYFERIMLQIYALLNNKPIFEYTAKTCRFLYGVRLV